MPDNLELFFRSERKVASGETVRLGADPSPRARLREKRGMTTPSIAMARAAAMSGCRCGCASPNAASTA